MSLSACRDFLQSTMGLCLGCCPRDSEGEVGYGPEGDRARLINGEIISGEVIQTVHSEDDLEEMPYGSLGDSNRFTGMYILLEYTFYKKFVPLLQSGNIWISRFLAWQLFVYIFSGSGIQFPASLSKTKLNDEQAALADIVNQMANGIIDVNLAHTTQTLEPAELQERSYDYGRQLQTVSAKLAQKYAHLRRTKITQPRQDAANVDKLLHSEIMNTSDTMLINEVAARAREASSEFKLEPAPHLIGNLLIDFMITW